MYLSIIQHVTFTVTKVIFKHGFFTLTQVWIWVKHLNTSTFNQSGPRVGSGSACLSCCSLMCPLDGAILKHLTLLLPHKVCRRGNWGNHLNWKQLVKLESHISGVKLFFILTFPDACQRTHTHTLLPARVCVCVCQRLFWPLTTSTFLSCVFDSTLSPDRTCGLSFCFFPGPSRNCSSQHAAAASELWISPISIDRKRQDVACLWFTALWSCDY